MEVFGENTWWTCLVKKFSEHILVRLTPCEGELVQVSQNLIVQARAQLGGGINDNVSDYVGVENGDLDGL